jgi:large subunit ribosomal protein L10
MPSQANVQQVDMIRERLQNTDVVLLTDFKGLTVAEVNELRQQLRGAGIQYKVCKNRLVKVVAQELGIEGLDDHLVGPTALATSDDPATCSKILKEFADEHEHLKIKGGLLGKTVIDAAGVEALIDMPSKEQLIAQAVGGIKAPLSGLVSVLHRGSPMTGLVNVLNGTVRQLTTALQAVADQKKEAGSA